MAYIEITTETHQAGSVQTWRLHRPSRGNALGPTMASELRAALATLTEASPLPRVLVITAAPTTKGPQRTWIAGGDLKELAAQPSQAEGERYALSLSDFLADLSALPIPVVVAVDGDAIGGGAELVLGGDWRLATADSRLVFKQLQVGLATGYGSARRLVELVGLARAQDLLYGCRSITAAEGQALGLVHEVCPDPASLDAAIQRRAHALLQLEPRALATQKRMLWHAVRSHPGAAPTTEARLFGELWGNPTHRRFLDQFTNDTKGVSR